MATTWKRLRSIREPNASTSVWSLPTNDEHLLNTGSPEDLFLNPEDFDLVPEVIQDGQNDWRKDNLITANWYTFIPDDPRYFYSWTAELSVSTPNWYTYDQPLSVWGSEI